MEGVLPLPLPQSKVKKIHTEEKREEGEDLRGERNRGREEEREGERERLEDLVSN